MKIIMIAAENDALPKGKVGGIGDVVRDIPLALARLGHDVQVWTPNFANIQRTLNNKEIEELNVSFRNHQQTVKIYKVEIDRQSAFYHKKIQHFVFDHAQFNSDPEVKIYHHDEPGRPFATDANNFALFGVATAEALLQQSTGKFDIIHLHDWHAAFVAVLRKLDNRYIQLRNYRCVFTIHNLALQGIRPIENDESSLAAWFPELAPYHQEILDPRYSDCINLMKAGIELSDYVHVVSPQYVNEILQPSQPDKGFFGGEGLEETLINKLNKGRLIGILNGCQYRGRKKPTLRSLNSLIHKALLIWASQSDSLRATHFIANQRLQTGLANQLSLPSQTGKMLVTSVGRLTNQKALLLVHRLNGDKRVIDHLLEGLGESGLFILLGSGDAELEKIMTQTMARHENFLFLNGFDLELAENLYSQGHLFLMPSSFEPCGISQMLAMREGQLCLVHHVGGLVNTVEPMQTGFAFSGKDLDQQAVGLLAQFQQAKECFFSNKKVWNTMKSNAKKQRFEWKKSAELYVEKLYR